MNIALKYMTGNVVEFLNAGDRFASCDVVSEAMMRMLSGDLDVVYGDVVYENPDGTVDIRKYPQSCSDKFYYLTGDCINHQAMFVKRRLFDGNCFDPRFKVCGDREWMLRAGVYRPKCSMTALGFPVVIYPLDGVSVINKDRYTKEAEVCIRRYIPAGYPLYLVF